MTNFKLCQDSVNHLFNPIAIFLFLLTGATWYYHAIHIVYIHVQESKFSEKIFKFGENLFKKWTLQSSWSLFFPSLVALHSCNFEGINNLAEFSPMQSYIGIVTCDICHLTHPEKWHVDIMNYRDILQICLFNHPVLNLYPQKKPPPPRCWTKNPC